MSDQELLVNVIRTCGVDGMMLYSASDSINIRFPINNQVDPVHFRRQTSDASSDRVSMYSYKASTISNFYKPATKAWLYTGNILAAAYVQ